MSGAADQTIFVAIASYNDPMLPHTLDHCLATARHPENLRFGICWQYDREQPVDVERFKRDPRFRFAEFTTKESEGGCWARNIAQKLWDGETYTMQVDSHMAFAHGWDASLIGMMQTLPADKPLITMIAPLFEWRDGAAVQMKKQGMRATAVEDWQESGKWAPWFTWGRPVGQALAPGYVVRNRFVSGMFVFTLGAWNEEVRQDPQHYYWGEEFAVALRSFTCGYDFFLPDSAVVFHMYHPDEPPRRHWEHGSHVVQSKNEMALRRLRHLAFGEGEDEQARLGRYGLEKARSLAEFETFSGMDLKNKKAHPDVFLGVPPDPVTIKSPSDWDVCLSFDDYQDQKSAKENGKG